jgi:hypothetical protein
MDMILMWVMTLDKHRTNKKERILELDDNKKSNKNVDVKLSAHEAFLE